MVTWVKQEQEWSRRFAFLPVAVEQIGNETRYVWLQFYEYRSCAGHDFEGYENRPLGGCSSTGKPVYDNYRY